MSTRTVDEMVAGYLDRLATAAARLSPARRTELLEEIRAHIDSAMAADRAADPVAVRTLLDRLGDPEEIVAAALDDEPDGTAGRPGVALGRPSIALEVTAVALLTLGSLIPLIGWLVGVILLWTSRRWRLGEKLIATLIVPGGPGLALFVLMTLPARVCSTGLPGPVEG